MENCGFHSPQFSEELAFLPPWLQPHQMPNLCRDTKDNRSDLIKHREKTNLEESICFEQNEEKFSGEAGYNSCHLYLSGQSNSCNGSIPSPSVNALHLSLHLSSSSEANNTTQITKENKLKNTCDILENKNKNSNFETNEPSSTTIKPFLEEQETHIEKINNQRCTKNDIIEKNIYDNVENKNKNSNLETNEPSSTIKPFLEEQETHNHKTEKDDFTLSQTDINEAIELSIAASETMVISELSLNESNHSTFNSNIALKAAIRVKQARKELFFEEVDLYTEFSDKEIYENDLLSDLDEFKMVDAYNDVGLYDNLSNLDEIDANNTGSILVPCSLKENLNMSPNLGFQYSGLREENLNTAPNLGFEYSGLREENMDIKQNSDLSINAFARVEEKQLTTQKNTSKKKKIKELFIQETSFISESIDTNKRSKNEIIGSSNPSNLNTGAFPSKELFIQETNLIPEFIDTTKKSQNEINASSNASNLNIGAFSSIDPLCSLVPCSIEEEDSVDPQANIFVPQNAPDVSCLVKRKRVNSLKVYSMGSKYDSNFGLNGDFGERNLKFETEEGIKKKKVKFLEVEFGDQEAKNNTRIKGKKGLLCSHSRSKRQTKNILELKPQNRKRKYPSLNGTNSKNTKESVFHGLEFLLTGFSRKKLKDLEILIRGNGGYVLSKLPKCPSDLKGKLNESYNLRPPVVLCPKKVSTTKFLYGCAVNSWVLNQYWLIDSIQAGSLLSPYRYLIREVQAYNPSYFIGDPFCFKKYTLIFDGIGFLLFGKVNFISKYSNITKHGGGEVYQSLQDLVKSLENGKIKTGLIIVENEARSSRYLKFCALEYNIQTVPVSWIIETLFCGKLVPFKRDFCAPFGKIKMPKFVPQDLAFDMSQEI